MELRKIAKGFTLIELLIVVAIIAILAAIAVPNFLEAQVRSKVSRAQADLRSLAVALESYRVDNNNYPVSTNAIDHPDRLCLLSTPVSYISNPLMRDVFKPQGEKGSNPKDWWAPIGNYIYAPFTHRYAPYLNRFNTYMRRHIYATAFPLVNGHDMKATPNSFPGPITWALGSYGPDGILQYDDDPMDMGIGGPDGEYMPYDATNGTRSRGDIFRFGP